MTLVDSLSVAGRAQVNPDVERDGPAPDVVVAWRAQVAAADGVLIASPEYPHSLPGSLKNALDWLVGSGELYGKRVAVLCGSPRPSGGALGRQALEHQTLNAQGAIVVSATVGVTAADEGIEELRDPAAVAAIEAAIVALTAWR